MIRTFLLRRATRRVTSSEAIDLHLQACGDRLAVEEESDAATLNRSFHQHSQRLKFDDDCDTGQSTRNLQRRRCEVELNHVKKQFDTNMCGAMPDLTPDEMFDQLTNLHQPIAYSYALFESVDIVHQLLLSGALSRSSGKSIASWMISAEVALRHPHTLTVVMGSSRWIICQKLLQGMLDDYDAIRSPIRRCCSLHAVSEEWCSFLRSCVSVAILSSEIAPLIPLCVEAMVAGTLKHPARGLRGSPRERAYVASSLLLESSVEFGSESILNIALELMQSFRIPRDYKIMLRVEQSMSKRGRRSKDWQLRRSGLLETTVPKWIRSYYPTTMHPEDTKKVAQHATTNAESSVQSPAMNSPNDHHSSPATTSVSWTPQELEALYDVTLQELSAARSRRQEPKLSSSLNVSDKKMPSGQKGVVDLSSDPPVAHNTSITSMAPAGPLITDAKLPALFFESAAQRHGNASQALDSAIHQMQKRHKQIIQESFLVALENTAPKVLIGTEVERGPRNGAFHLRPEDNALIA